MYKAWRIVLELILRQSYNAEEAGRSLLLLHCGCSIDAWQQQQQHLTVFHAIPIDECTCGKFPPPGFAGDLSLTRHRKLHSYINGHDLGAAVCD